MLGQSLKECEEKSLEASFGVPDQAVISVQGSSVGRQSSSERQS